MVSLLGGLTPTQVAARLTTFMGKRVGENLKITSQRELAIKLGIPRSTLQDFLRAPEKRRASTVANIVSKLESSTAQVVTTMGRSFRVDAPYFTRDTLRMLKRPDIARGFRFVILDERYGSGLASTITNLNPTESPEDALGMVGGDPGAIVSVVWVVR